MRGGHVGSRRRKPIGVALILLLAAVRRLAHHRRNAVRHNSELCSRKLRGPQKVLVLPCERGTWPTLIWVIIYLAHTTSMRYAGLRRDRLTVVFSILYGCAYGFAPTNTLIGASSPPVSPIRATRSTAICEKSQVPADTPNPFNVDINADAAKCVFLSEVALTPLGMPVTPRRHRVPLRD